MALILQRGNRALNGEIFHGDAAKRKRWQALKNSRKEPLLYDALLQAAVAKANAVIKFYRLLRVHGHVEPVPGDPTLDRLELHYWKRETGGYQHFFPNGGDAESLVRYLRMGFRAEKRRMERFLRGKPLPEDLEPYDEI